MPNFLLLLFILILFSCKNYKEKENDQLQFPFNRYNLLKSDLLNECSKEVHKYYEISAKHPKSSVSLIKLLNERKGPQIKKNINGYITFSFIVNCKGQIGEFIIYQLDQDFNRKTYDEQSIEILREFILDMKDFKIYEDKNYYYYLTFKIGNGKVIDILP